MNVRDVFPYGFRHEKVTARRNMPKTRMRIVRKYRIDRIVPPPIGTLFLQKSDNSTSR
jgi:hypothetical protein